MTMRLGFLASVIVALINVSCPAIAQPGIDAFMRLLDSPTFPKTPSDKDWEAIAAIRADPTSVRQLIVDELVRADGYKPQAFHVVNYLPVAEQEVIMTQVVTRLPVGATQPAYVPFLQRLALRNKTGLARVEQDIRADPEGRGKSLAHWLAREELPEGKALVAKLSAEFGHPWELDAQPSPDRKWAEWDGIGVELAVPNTSFPSFNEVVIAVTVTNKGKTERSIPVPRGPFGSAGNLFDVRCDGEKLPSAVGARNQEAFVQTTLQPAERVTFFVAGENIADWPETAKPSSRCIVAVSDVGFGFPFLARNTVDFRVVPGLTVNRTFPPIQSNADWARAAHILRSMPSSHARGSILRQAMATGNATYFWGLIGELDSVGLICEVLPDLDAAMAVGEELLALAERNDLAIRRAAFRALANMGPDPELLGKARELQKQQHDKTTRELADAAVKALEPKGR